MSKDYTIEKITSTEINWLKRDIAYEMKETKMKNKSTFFIFIFIFVFRNW
jgi:hypothetical protein